MEELIAFLLKAYCQIHSEHSNFSFDKGRSQHYYLVCLYATILEISQDCLLLYENYPIGRHIVSLPILLRSNMEAYVDFINLIKDENYGDTMKASWLKQNIKLLKEALNNQDNPYIKNLRSYGNVEKRLEEFEKEFQSLKNKNINPQFIANRFRLAGLTNEYNSIYILLCSYTHNSPFALEKRHFQRSGEDYHLVVSKVENLEELLPYFDMLCEILVCSSQLIHNFFGSPIGKDMDKLWEEFMVIRQSYSIQLNNTN